jgi:hypothetical protein
VSYASDAHRWIGMSPARGDRVVAVGGLVTWEVLERMPGSVRVGRLETRLGVHGGGSHHCVEEVGLKLWGDLVRSAGSWERAAS